MPELPEVEVVVNAIRPKLIGRMVVDLWTNCPRLFRDTVKFGELKKLVKGRKIQAVRRYGKNILLYLDNEFLLIIHLMMSGQLFFGSRYKKDPYIRFKIYLDRNDILNFRDVRKFGKVILLAPEKQATFLTGKDALQLTRKDFVKLFSDRVRKSTLKSALLNQKLISGIGNIYADEILWYAKLSPQRRLYTLSPQEINSLYTEMRKVLAMAIKKGGSSMQYYRKPDGAEGKYFNTRKVYKREGYLCFRCKASIQRIKLAGRSTYFCPTCQQ